MSAAERLRRASRRRLGRTAIHWSIVRYVEPPCLLAAVAGGNGICFRAGAVRPAVCDQHLPDRIDRHRPRRLATRTLLFGYRAGCVCGRYPGSTRLHLRCVAVQPVLAAMGRGFPANVDLFASVEGPALGSAAGGVTEDTSCHLPCPSKAPLQSARAAPWPFRPAPSDR